MSRQIDDKTRDETQQSRVDYIHGGEKVFAISPNDLIEVSNASKCEHEWEKDDTEVIGDAFVCNKCGSVVIYPSKKDDTIET